MRVRRIETVIQFVAGPEASKRSYADLLSVEPTPCDGRADALTPTCGRG